MFNNRFKKLIKPLANGRTSAPQGQKDKKMKVDLKHIKISELVEKYEDFGEEGVKGYGGRLQIRMSYHRKRLYNDKRRKSLVHSIMMGFPIGTMYWNDLENGNYGMMDGEQRSIAIAQYVLGEFSVDNLYFHNLSEGEKQKFLDYELMVYLCTGSPDEKLEWLETIHMQIDSSKES